MISSSGVKTQRAEAPPAWATQELGPEDVLEVEAIAEQLPSAPTDDSSGHAPSSSVLRGMYEVGSLSEDDAYFHPGGSIRSLADATLDGWRPMPTMVFRRVRARSRRSWLLLGLIAFVGPLLLTALIVRLNDPAPAADRSARLHSAEATRSPLATALTTRASINVRDMRDVRGLPARPTRKAR